MYSFTETPWKKEKVVFELSMSDAVYAQNCFVNCLGEAVSNDKIKEEQIYRLSFSRVEFFIAETPGGHLHINVYGTCRFSGYHFSA